MRKRRFIGIKSVVSIVLALGFLLSVVPAAVSAAPAKYNAGDVAVINNIIAKNGLIGYKKNKPETWDFAAWKNGRIVLLHLNSSPSTFDEQFAYEQDSDEHPLKGTLNVSKLANLTELLCDGNALTALNISQNTKLKKLSCSGNRLTALNVSKNTALTELYCNSNRLTSLNVSKNTKLTDLSCSGNRLAALNVSKNTRLKDLDCSSNKLTSLNIAKLTHLKSLLCSNNRLKTLDVSKNFSLQELDCSQNKITTLNLKGLKRLSIVTFLSNFIQTLTLTNGDVVKIAPSVGGLASLELIITGMSNRVAILFTNANDGYRFDHYEFDKPVDFENINLPHLIELLDVDSSDTADLLDNPSDLQIPLITVLAVPQGGVTITPVFVKK